MLLSEAAETLAVGRTTFARGRRGVASEPLRDYRGWRFYRAEDIERLRKWRKPKPVVSDSARTDRLSG